MLFFVVSLIIVVALLLILVVLAQNSKGGGLSSQFGGSGTSQIMGVKKTGDLLEKITWGLAIVLLALSLSTNFLISNEPAGLPNSPNIDRAQDQTILPNIGDTENSEEGGLGIETEDGNNDSL